MRFSATCRTEVCSCLLCTHHHERWLVLAWQAPFLWKGKLFAPNHLMPIHEHPGKYGRLTRVRFFVCNMCEPRAHVCKSLWIKGLVRARPGYDPLRTAMPCQSRLAPRRPVRARSLITKMSLPFGQIRLPIRQDPRHSSRRRYLHPPDRVPWTKPFPKWGCWYSR